MEIKQQLKLSQQLVMTPQLQQAIRLLQLSRLELIDEIRKELDANPLLADDEVEPRPPGVNKDGQVDRSESVVQESEARADLSERMHDKTEELARAEQEKKVNDIDWEQFLENRTLQQPLPQSRGGFEDLPPIEANLTKVESLVDHHTWAIDDSIFVKVPPRTPGESASSATYRYSSPGTAPMSGATRRFSS